MECIVLGVTGILKDFFGIFIFSIIMHDKIKLKNFSLFKQCYYYVQEFNRVVR